eukprot:2584843-Amphidinium_carterae.1
MGAQYYFSLRCIYSSPNRLVQMIKLSSSSPPTDAFLAAIDQAVDTPPRPGKLMGMVRGCSEFHQGNFTALARYLASLRPTVSDDQRERCLEILE